MMLPLSKTIVPMSELRADPGKVKARLKESPLLVTNKGRPDFGICDLETFDIAIKINEIKKSLESRLDEMDQALPAKTVFQRLEAKYSH